MKDGTSDGAVMGRPTIYSDELADEICLRMSHGRSLNDICKDSDMPDRSNVYVWLRKYDDFQDKYREATGQRADCHFDEMLSIADDVMPETAEVAKAKLQIDTRKWILSRMNPRKYGDNIQEDDGNNDNVQPVQVTVNVRDARKPDA